MNILTRLSDLSPVIKFAIGAGLFLVCFLVIIEPTLKRQGDFASRANEARDSLAHYVSNASELRRLETQVARGEARYGPVDLPASFEERSADLNEDIRKILDDNSIERESITAHTNKMPKDTLAGVVGAGRGVELIKKTIRFDATPEQLADVVAAFEQSPFVVGISRLDVRRDGNGQRRVLVDMTVDGWVLETQGANQ